MRTQTTQWRHVQVICVQERSYATQGIPADNVTDNGLLQSNLLLSFFTHCMRIAVLAVDSV